MYCTAAGHRRQACGPLGRFVFDKKHSRFSILIDVEYVHAPLKAVVRQHSQIIIYGYMDDWKLDGLD